MFLFGWFFQLAYIPYDPNQVLGVSGSYMGNSQLVQRPGPTVQQSANSYYNATSAGNFYLQNNSAFQFILENVERMI